MATATAHTVREQFEAVAFVSLASVANPDDVAVAIADALDVKEAEQRTAIEAIAERIAALRERTDLEVFPICAILGDGCDDLLARLRELVEQLADGE